MMDRPRGGDQYLEVSRECFRLDRARLAAIAVAPELSAEEWNAELEAKR